MKQHSEDEEAITVVTVNLQLRFVIYPPIQASAISVEEAGHTAQNHSSLIGPLESASATIFSDPLTW